MNRRLRWWPLAVLVIVLTVASTAQTSANTVASTKMVNNTRTIGANDLKPVDCASLSLTTIVTGSGTITATSANELVLGSAGVDNINGGFGTDCILGGGGNDTINGGAGVDVCIGGPGTDTFSNCETQVQ